MNPQVCSYALDHIHQVSDASINICCSWISVGAQHVRNLRFLIVFDKVPNLLMWSKRSDELALLVLNDTKLKRIIRLFFLNLLARCGQFHSRSLPLLQQVFLNPHCDGLHLQLLSIASEALDHDCVLNVLQYLVVDSSQGCGPRIPKIFFLLLILIVVLPDPSPLRNSKQKTI